MSTELEQLIEWHDNQANFIESCHFEKTSVSLKHRRTARLLRELAADKARLEKAILVHVNDLEKCPAIFRSVPNGVFEKTAQQCELAVEELRAALAAQKEAK